MNSLFRERLDTVESTQTYIIQSGERYKSYPLTDLPAHIPIYMLHLCWWLISDRRALGSALEINDNGKECKRAIEVMAMSSSASLRPNTAKGAKFNPLMPSHNRFVQTTVQNKIYYYHIFYMSFKFTIYKR